MFTRNQRSLFVDPIGLSTQSHRLTQGHFYSRSVLRWPFIHFVAWSKPGWWLKGLIAWLVMVGCVSSRSLQAPWYHQGGYHWGLRDQGLWCRIFDITGWVLWGRKVFRCPQICEDALEATMSEERLAGPRMLKRVRVRLLQYTDTSLALKWQAVPNSGAAHLWCWSCLSTLFNLPGRSDNGGRL